MAVTALLVAPANARQDIYEREPNDVPETANRIAGAARLLGSMPPGDQDGYLWTVSDVDAQKRWTLQLDGIPGALTVLEVIRLTYAEDGVSVAGREVLLKLGSRDGSRPAEAMDLMFAPGDYLLGIARGGGDAPFRPPVDSVAFEAGPAGTPVPSQDPRSYRLQIREGAPLGGTPARDDTGERESPLTVRPGEVRLDYTSEEERWFDISVDNDEAGLRWSLLAQSPVGTPLHLSLFDSEGRELGDAAGGKSAQASLPALSLAAGAYRVLIRGEPDTLRRLEIRESGPRVEGHEAEPNDAWRTASRIDLKRPVVGGFQRKRDSDFYAFTVAAADAERRLRIDAVSDDGSKFELCLLDAQGQAMQCRVREGRVALDDLSLAPGDYGLSLDRGSEGSGYTLSETDLGPLEPGREMEPNDAVDLATAMPPGRRIKGRLETDDTDFFRLVIDDAPELWRLQVLGEGVRELLYHDGSGAEVLSLRAGAGQRRTTLDNLFLMPGVHYVGVSGAGQSEYTLLMRSLGQPDPGAEREPNDDTTRMLPLDLGLARTGLLSDPGDHDNYRFHLAGQDHLRLELQPPPDGSVRARLYRGDTPLREAVSSPGEVVVLEGLFPPGDYRLELVAESPSDAEYRLRRDRLPRFSCAGDCEPNDSPAQASDLPRGGVLRGQVGEWGDEDWYALPLSAQPVDITVTTDEKLNIDLVAGPRERGGLERDADGVYRGNVPAGEQYYLHLRGRGHYDARVALDGTEAPPPPAHTFSAALALEASRVAAYHVYGQQVSGELRIENAGAQAVSLTLTAASSDARWTLTPAASVVQVGAGAAAVVPVTIHVPSDAWADRPVRLSLRAQSDEGVAVAAQVDVTPERGMALLAPTRHWTVPDPLRGGLNVAWHALGGRWQGEDDRRIGQGLGELFDGRAVRDEGLSLRARNAPRAYQSVVRLAGETAPEVAGIALNPLGRDDLSRSLRRFSLSLSDDGQTFESVLEGVLSPRPVEQYFVLPQARPARFARLDLIDDHGGDRGGSRGLGEWKVIATPGWDLSGGAGFNLADAALGGHVVWANPVVSRDWDDVMLQPDSPPARLRLRAGKSLSWAVGFHHNRAALVRGFEWADSPDGEAAERLTRVDIAVSVDSPLGPWRSLGEWSLDSAERQRFELEQATWARFVRFTVPAAAREQVVEVPGAVRVLEQPTNDTYRSVLAEWSDGGREGIFEALTPLPTPVARQSAAHTRRDSAAALLPDTPVGGEVSLDQERHWYRLQVPENDNTLGIAVSAQPTLRAQVLLETEAGEAIALRTVEQDSTMQRLEAVVVPGSTVFLQVFEPPRNVIFAWDTSASVGAYLPAIYSALSRYAADLVPGRDMANLMPFGARMLMPDWHAEPYWMQTILNEYPREESSSAAEGTLARASQALAQRAGVRSIVLITDAATVREPRVWTAFAEARPRIFALGLDSTGALGRSPAREQDLLQDWASVNGGHYAPLRSVGEMEVAFDRAATLLRGPAPYRLQVDTQYREAPGPGTLVVRRGEDSSTDPRGNDDALLFILDASGSMLQRLEGRRRIEIARDLLMEALTRHVPAGSPVALRVFGHREPDACRSDLEIPLQPLDPEAASASIGRVEARNLARTPIADSLARAETDLAGAAGRKTIVLLTDGEETCDGNAEEIITALRDRGFDMRLNIVGFSLADERVEAEFSRLAELGGGRYFAATDSAELRRVLEAALRTPFRVLDAAGDTVAEGLVDGEPVSLPAGVYQVVVDGATQVLYEDVSVSGGEHRRLTIE